MRLVDMVVPPFRGLLVASSIGTHVPFYVKSTQDPDEPEKFLPYGYNQRKVALFNPENPRHGWLAFDAFACAVRLSEIIRDLGADRREPLTPQEMVYLARCRWEEQPEFGANNLVGPEPDYDEDSFAPDMGPNVASMDAKTHDAAMSVLYACMTHELGRLEEPESFMAASKKAENDAVWAVCGILASDDFQRHVRPESHETIDREFAKALRKARDGSVPSSWPFIREGVGLSEIGEETIRELATQTRVAARKLGAHIGRNSDYVKRHFGTLPPGARLNPFETLYVARMNKIDDCKTGLFEGTRKLSYQHLFNNLGEHEKLTIFEPVDRIVRREISHEKPDIHPAIRALKARRPIGPRM